MTKDRESSLFEFAVSGNPATNEEEQIVTDIHAALGFSSPPIRLMHPPVPKPNRTWQRYGFAAITIALIFAVATAGYFAIDYNSTTPPPTEVPPVVLGLASQEPEASPVAETCDLSGDIPLFVGVDESPLDRTSVIVTLDQEMKLVCEDRETILAEEVQMATPTQTPYVLLLMTQTGQMLLNIQSGESIHIQQPPPQTEQTIGLQTWDGWALLPSTNTVDGLSLYSLDSFSEIPVTVGPDAITINSVSGMAIGANDDVFALAITDDLGEGSKILTSLFIANLDGTSHTVQTPRIHDPSQFAISPDGSTVAVVSFVGEPANGTKTLSLIDTIDGSLINEFEIGTLQNFIDLNWLNDGSALLYTNGVGLYSLSAPDAEPTTILEGNNVQGLALTREDDVVAVGHRKSLESGGFQPVTTIINLKTGEQQELEGRDLWSGSSMATRRSTLLLSERNAGLTSETTVYSVVDAVTGEILGEIEQPPQEQGFFNSSWGFDRNINAVAFLPDLIWMLTDAEGEPTVIQVLPPNLESEPGALSITISPDGFITLRTYEPYTAWILLPEESEWVEVNLPEPSESQGVNANIGIIPGDD